MQFIPKTDFDFVANRYKLLALSGVLMAVSVASLAFRGLNYGIDFTGGTALRLTFASPITVAELRGAIGRSESPDAALQSFDGTNSFALRLKTGEQSAGDMERYLASIQKEVGANKFIVDSKEFVGPTVGKHLYRQALWAIVLSLLGIVVYVAFRFDNIVWGLAGIIALWHDVIATLGLFSVLGFEVDLLIVSAILAIAGYSINDTIVIFDRMRENLRLHRREDLGSIINKSINETLSRTLITNLFVFFVVVSLFFFGGKVIHDFATAMVFGAVVGTYSTIALAAPLVYEWARRNSPTPAPSAASSSARPKPLKRGA